MRDETVIDIRDPHHHQTMSTAGETKSASTSPSSELKIDIGPASEIQALVKEKNAKDDRQLMEKFIEAIKLMRAEMKTTITDRISRRVDFHDFGVDAVERCFWIQNKDFDWIRSQLFGQGYTLEVDRVQYVRQSVRLTLSV